jgi:RecA/RadA recombinase
MEVEQEITVSELKRLYDTDEYDIELDTPDGYQKISKWFNKGVLNMITVSTVNHTTTCAVNHMIQLDDNDWALASELDEGVLIQTISGIEPIISITQAASAECYDFEIQHQNHRYYGDGIVSHNSGKSFICSGNLIRTAQEMGIFVILIDSENALDKSWLHALGVDTGEDKLLKLNMAMINDVATVINEFVKEYRSGYGDMMPDDRPEILFVVDSLGMLMSPTDLKQFQDGDMKGDMGRKAKQLKALVTNCVNMFGDLNIGLVCTNHTYASQDMFDPDDKISGGSGLIFAASIVVAIKKLKLKIDAEGNKTPQVHGIRASCKVVKTRYSKPFESVKISIPYETGMDPTSGLVEFFESTNKLKKVGNRLEYTSPVTGEVILMFRKKYENNDNNILNTMMDEFDIQMKTDPTVQEDTVDTDSIE